MKAALELQVTGQVHCPICTHTVPADIEVSGKRAKVVPGQRCSRCAATLDAAWIVYLPQAA